VIRHAHADRADAVRFRAFDRFLRCEHREHVPDPVVAFDDCDRAAVDYKLRRRHRLHHAVQHALEIPAEAQHAVRLVPPEVGLHERVRNEPRILLRHSRTGVNRSREIDEAFGVDACCCH
jgi:hypothetical protein